ncbi:MAG: tetratricopeptide repeat protein [Velocimicrobium sp.]
MENPITVNPFTEKSKTVPSITDTPHTEHPTQVINNKVNNKRLNNHQSIFQRKDGETEVIPTISKSLVPMQELIERFEYSELCQILSYHHLLQECRECQLSQYDIKARVIEELKYLISYETLVFDGDGAMVDAWLQDYEMELGNARKYEERIVFCRKIIELFDWQDDDDSCFQCGIGDSLFYEGKKKEAYDHYEKWLAENPQNN